MNYSIDFPLEHNNYGRYLFHSNLYLDESLEKTNVLIKADLLNFMRHTFGNLKGVINVNILKDVNYQVLLTFNLDTSDVYYVCRYQDSSECWQALLMFGENNANHIDKLEIDNKIFNTNINKPIKYLMVFIYKKLKEFLNNNINELKDTTKTVESLLALYEESVNKIKGEENNDKADDSKAVSE